MHWWSPGAKNNGNPSAKVIIIVFFVLSIVWNLQINEKIMKFRSPFNVTQKAFRWFSLNSEGRHWKVKFFKNRSGAYIVSISEVFGVAPMQPRLSLTRSEGACHGVHGAALN